MCKINKKEMFVHVKGVDYSQVHLNISLQVEVF